VSMPNRIKVPATLDNLHKAMAFVISYAEEAGFPQDRIMEIELALEEVLVNIINYAYPNGAGDMEITCTPYGDNGFLMEIADQGIPFNALDVGDPDVTSGIEDRKVGGLGIYFVKKLMDDVSHTREDGYNILKLSVLKNKPGN
jgi:serine/threonine-protein kinase RsbW